MSESRSLPYAQEFVDYVNASPTPYHAVKNVKTYLLDAGFVELRENAKWDKPANSGKYFVTRNGSSLIAFTVGGKYETGNGVGIVGAHTDSPCLRIKPISKKTSEGFIQVGVEQYGGLIAHSWFDRDLSIAGRVYVTDSEGNYVPKLIKIDKPLLRIPTLAIHLDRSVKDKFEFNKETKLIPIAGQIALDKNELKNEKTKKDAAHSCADDPALQMSPEQFESVQSVITRHNESLVELIAKECGVEPKQIEDFELVLFDHQKSTIGGLNEEFIFSPRLDNLTSCFCATKGLIDSTKGLSDQETIQLISLFDHEEIGSVSAQGADSTFLPDTLYRLVDFASFHQVMANSFLLSSDMAHGVHPNYGENYEASNRPHVNKGPVIKINANQRYATNSPGIVLLKKCAELAKVPLQLFVVRNDSPCGSTIGPILSAKLGIRTLDLGNPQLSMHSIRETGGTYDVVRLCDLFESFFNNYYNISTKIQCDGAN
ncbi:aspartyl aminopeptidase 4 [[Candida] railenensis]|uniref:aspartyl aminopeptidase n=1 Tax=[Candida] railenensis TaxID=45579 RepID=A0A9P0QML4_9ASCO|nr:aspartyl aminopeptidase 4 [[Candida] railenensis]